MNIVLQQFSQQFPVFKLLCSLKKSTPQPQNIPSHVNFGKTPLQINHVEHHVFGVFYFNCLPFQDMDPKKQCLWLSTHFQKKKVKKYIFNFDFHKSSCKRDPNNRQILRLVVDSFLEDQIEIFIKSKSPQNLSSAGSRHIS